MRVLHRHLVPGVLVCAFLQQQPGNLELAVHCSEVQRCQAILRGHRTQGVRAAKQWYLSALTPTSHLVLGLLVCTVHHQQQLGDLELAIHRSTVQRGRALLRGHRTQGVRETKELRKQRSTRRVLCLLVCAELQQQQGYHERPAHRSYVQRCPPIL